MIPDRCGPDPRPTVRRCRRDGCRSDHRRRSGHRGSTARPVKPDHGYRRRLGRRRALRLRPDRPRSLAERRVAVHSAAGVVLRGAAWPPAPARPGALAGAAALLQRDRPPLASAGSSAGGPAPARTGTERGHRRRPRLRHRPRRTALWPGGPTTTPRCGCWRGCRTAGTAPGTARPRGLPPGGCYHPCRCGLGDWSVVRSCCRTRGIAGRPRRGCGGHVVLPRGRPTPPVGA
jgi:hypothetical protein